MSYHLCYCAHLEILLQQHLVLWRAPRTTVVALQLPSTSLLYLNSVPVPVHVFAFTEVWVQSNLYVALVCRISCSVQSILLGMCSCQTVEHRSHFPLHATATLGPWRVPFGEDVFLDGGELSSRFCPYKNLVICTNSGTAEKTEREQAQNK